MISTREDLIVSVANWLNRDDLSVDEIPEAIGLAEQRFNRVLRVPEMEEVVTSQIDGATITLPTDFLELRAVYLATDPKCTLQQLSLAELRTTYAAGWTGQPQHFALQSSSEMVFGPAPDVEYDLIINYYQKIPALVEDADTNWLLTDHAGIYLAACIAELRDFMADEGRADRMEAKLLGRIAELNSQAKKKAYGAAPLRIRSPYNV